MNVAVVGLWHLGCVTAACLASAGHDVLGFDRNSEVVVSLQRGEPPIFEPGLREMVKGALAAGKLGFSSDSTETLRAAEVVWVTFDTPVDEKDQADVEFVLSEIRSLFSKLRPDSVILISSQVPVGSTARMEREFAETFPGVRVGFAYSPENLRLGKALEVFMHPDRVIVGCRDDRGRRQIAGLLAPITDRIEWMSVESAEMTKHAINSFLATSVTFMNEIATICENVGADAKEVERGLKSESRIGPKAYLAPGGAFAGGTLARDINFLVSVGLDTPLLQAVGVSNELHKEWPRRKLRETLGDLSGKKVALLGLTYKPGTDTLRRSAAVELGRWLFKENAKVVAFDPAVQELPPEISSFMQRCKSAREALGDSDAAVVCTEWPDFRELNGDDFVNVMRSPLVLDANRFLAATVGSDSRIEYLSVGKPVNVRK